MNNKVIVAIATAICIGLAIGLFAVKNRGEQQHAKDTSSILALSNQWDQANAKITELNDVNLVLNKELQARREQLANLTNQLASANNTIQESRVSLADAQLQITNLSLHITNLNARITDLEFQNKSLDDRAVELTNTIAKLDASIAEIRAKLARSEGDNLYLRVELQKQMAAKAELEHKFVDLNILRAQVAKIKEELFVARHVQLMRGDTTGKKGAELLNSRTVYVPGGSQSAAPNYNLNVEIGSDGSVRVIPPLGATNVPARP